MSFRYFGFGEERRFRFLQMPLLLYSDSRFRNLPGDAKTIYAFMLDRTWLSRENGWIDEAGRAFIYFTFEEIERVLNIGHNRASKLLTLLEKYELIQRVRQGLGKPNRIYVGDFYREESFQEFKNSQNGKSGNPESGDQEFPKQEGIYTENNQTEMNQTNPIYPCDEMDGMDVDNALSDYLEEQCCFESLKREYPHRGEDLDSIKELIIEVCTSVAPTIRINSEDRPTETVKSRFMKLNTEHIRYVMDCLKENTRKVSNIRAYLLTALFNAPVTIGHYYQALVNYDMAHPENFQRK